MSIQGNEISADPKSVYIPNTLMYVDVQTSSLTGLQAKEQGSSGDEFAPKVRKPYTITKQRERWTEEEHRKFLEALQLYGRAWRRIEEHIGTKTAVQIRSHAQKFFSKVVRESASNGTGNVKSIEIPPPRPKRKPVHPYPRKMGNTPSNGSLTIGKLGRSSSPILSASEQGNGSPTSVLSAFGSDTMSLFLSNLPNQCASPVASAAGSNEQDTSTEEENRPAYPGQTTPALTEQKQNHSPMELDLRCGGRVASKEASIGEAPVPCLKLFGRTVMVADSQKPSSFSVANVALPNSMSLPSVDIEKQDKSSYANLGAPPLPLLPGALHGDFPWSGGMLPMFYPSASNYGETMNPVEPRQMPLPWWALCGNLPLSFLHQQNLWSRQGMNQFCAEALSDKLTPKACSWTGSNTASAAEGGNTVSSKCTELGRSVENGDNDKSGRGFVPYKRCIVVEREEQHPQGMSDDGEGQSIGLCL